MKKTSKKKAILLVCLLLLSLTGFIVSAKAYDRICWIKKDSEFQIVWWFDGWSLTLYIESDRSYDSGCGHYYLSSHNEEYSAAFGMSGFTWTEYSEDKDYTLCPLCHRILEIEYEVHGRFYFPTDSSNYYDITLAESLDYADNTDYTFGPFSNHLKGTWRFYETSGLET